VRGPTATGERLHLIDDRGRDPLLRRLADPALAVPPDEDDLVVRRVEADVVAAHVVVDDEIDVFVGEHAALALEARLALVGAERDDDLAVAPPGGKRRDDVRRRLQVDRPRLLVLRAFVLERLGGPVVGDCCGHQHDVNVLRPRPDLALDVRCGRRLDNVDRARRRDREVGRDQRHLRASPARLLGERDAHQA
jgi:hypothetical protein